MKGRLVFVLAFCLAAGLATAVAQRSKDSTVADPDVHHVVLENEHIRVFEARAAAGRKSPMHSHPPFVLISINSARVKLTTPDRKTQMVDLRPGSTLWFGDGAEHSWELLAGELHAVAVEVKSARASKGD